MIDWGRREGEGKEMINGVRKEEGRYLGRRSEAGVEVRLVHPILQIANPKGTNVVQGGGLRR